ncbi:laminin subunit alpha-2-like isoform X3 [Apostichopus japonicus]|uniref:laminin subunit alpha-2-like isoform X3 n=1 Tax=Stichopus japonicus TaxID=307972 RepID=UPI003AB62505
MTSDSRHYKQLLVVVILVMLHVDFQVCGQTPMVNVALNKPVTAHVTCGSPIEDFYAHKEISKLAQDRVRSICDSSNATLAHPPSNAVDLDSSIGENYTWWQSTSKNNLLTLGFNNPDTIFTVDLQEIYTIQHVRIQMGDSVRPEQMALLKSNDGITFTPWEYKVSSDFDCFNLFDVSSANTAVESSETVICSQYTSVEQPRNEIISFDFIVPEALKDWQKAKYVRFAFYNMPLSFGFLSDVYHHYTIRNIEVLAPCNCNSHADECTLQPSPDNPDSLQTYQCECKGNTNGANCQECLPFYNQFAYQTGERGYVCQECNCFGHSQECVFDSDIGSVNASLDRFGNLFGGGVCLNCKNNTAGVNCESCKLLYFRPAGKSVTDKDGCQPCDCFLPGTRSDFDIEKGDCVTDQNNLQGLSLGDCYCKSKVIGPRCDQCAPTTYELTEANPDGCIDCGCFTRGTIDSSDVCNTTTGQCPCKMATTNRECDLCLAGYFNLSAENPNGCTECGCDVGGSTSLECDRVTGECRCRRSVTGRQCSRASAESFVPTLHYISAEFEYFGHPHFERDVLYAGYHYFGYVTLTGVESTSTTLTIPSSAVSGEYEILLRVITQGLTRVEVTITPSGVTQGTPLRGTSNIPLCPSWCSEGEVFNSDPVFGKRFLLAPGEWEVRVDTTLQGGARLLLDQVVALPIEFLNTEDVLGADRSSQFSSRCDVRTNEIGRGTSHEAFCTAQAFSLITFYFNGTLDCDCDLVGSLSIECDVQEGQCQCKPGVGGRRCDTCLPEFYAFGPTGCTECSCSSENKVCDLVTGQCDCPPNTAGSRCDRCVTFAYGYDNVTGCTMCLCNSVGSVHLNCDPVTGQCPCKSGVGTRECSQCLQGYKMFGSDGCKSCECDVAGSQPPVVCDPLSGQCNCKALVQGLSCNECTPGSFFLSESNQDGCLECVCTGITTECGSSSQRYTQFPIDDRVVPANLPVNSNLLWQIPQSYLAGDLLSMYGGELVLMVSYEAFAPIVVTVNVLLKGADDDAVYGGSLLDPTTTLMVPMRESVWFRPNSDPLTRSEFLMILYDVRGVFISATMSDSTHTSRVNEIYFFKGVSSSSPMYDSNGPRAFPVEECSCGQGYEGLSCQYCAGGYFRQNVSSHPFLGTCQPCQCNGHSEDCNVDTGECVGCIHNTEGFNCEHCLVGYYGEATMGTDSDCLQCPCSNLTTDGPACDVINGILVCLHCSKGHTGPTCQQCEEFYYGQPDQAGGFCAPCDCNNNTDQCDPSTGMCLNCQFRTEGFNCERCQTFLFGNATQRDCQDCNCVPDGSIDLICDGIDGQCPCLSNVTGRQCDRCLPNFYGYGGPDGCQPCSCNLFGSADLQCFQNGTCRCLADTTGDNCDQCLPGSYGLPLAQCQSCTCDPLGTIGGNSAICDPVDGQCPCVDGVNGIQCNQCAAGYIDFVNGACTKCDLCVDTLLSSILDLDSLLTNHSTDLDMVQQFSERDKTLLTLEPQINESLLEMRSLLTQLTLLRTELEIIDVQNLTQVATDVSDEVNMAVNGMQTQLSNSQAEFGRITIINEDVLSALQSTEDLALTADGYVTVASNLNSTSYLMAREAANILAAINQVSFDMLQRIVLQELPRSESLLDRAANYSGQTNQQAVEASSLSGFLESTRQRMSDLEVSIASVQGSLDTADGDLLQINSLLNQRDALEEAAENLIGQTEEKLVLMKTLINQTSIAVGEANQALVDTKLILNGSQAGNQGVPVPETLDQGDVNGWTEAESAVRNMLLVIGQLETLLAPLVINTESHAQTLELETLSSQNILANALTVSQMAYQAIQSFQKVVSVVNQAGDLARNATAVSQSVQEYLNDRNIATLESEARTLKTESAQLLDQVNNLNLNIPALETTLNEANSTVEEGKRLWSSVEGSTNILESAVQDLQAHVSDSSISEVIRIGDEAANTTIEYATSLLRNISQLNSSVVEGQATVQTLQVSVNQSTSMINDLPDRVTSLETKHAEVSQKLETLYQLSNQTTELRSRIADKMAALKEKLAQAQHHLINSRLPARFEGSTALAIRRDSEALQTPFDEVRLSFQTEKRDGVLFFTENMVGDSFMSLEIIASRVVFRFRIANDIVRILSPIDVCCREWYDVLATRYANQGELTVTKVSTGGSSTNFDRSLNVFLRYMPFEANTTFYIGGIPRNYQLTLALSNDFTGCISDFSFEKEEFDLWQPYQLEGSTSCCAAPAEVDPTLPSSIDGINFGGFGSLQLSLPDFDIQSQNTISLEFRTSVSEATILSVTRPDLISYIGVFLSGGRVVFEINTAGNAKYTIPSSEMYNDATWYKVLVSYNTTNYKMEVSYTNGTIRELIERRTLYPLSFPNLKNSPKVYLGSADPANSATRGPTSLSFAGCMRNLNVINSTTGILEQVAVIPDIAVNPEGVEFTGCLEEVTTGFGFRGDLAYAQLALPDQLQFTRSLQFYFKTEHPDGILAYSYDSQSFNKLFYVTLYHGNIFVHYNVGKGLSEPLQTKGQKFNTGQWQLVAIQFTALSVSLKVNNQATIYSNRQLGTDGIQINGLSNSFLYLGGVPATIPVLIGGQFPIRKSLSGDMNQFSINNFSPNLNDPEVVIKEKGLVLNGISPEVEELPPLPYPTDTPGQGTQSPQSCQSPVVAVPYPDVYRFGAIDPESYLAFTLEPFQADYFLLSFVITLQFRAHVSDGVLYYGADQKTNPSEWFALMLDNGKLSFRMMTSSTSIGELNVSTKKKYDTGVWYQTTVLRINRFIAILVDETGEYESNGQSTTSDLSQINVRTDLYVGGIPATVANSFISSSVNGSYFDGCIRSLEISGNFERELVLPLSSPDERKNVELCEQNDVNLNTYFDGSGYLQLYDDVTITDNFRVEMEITTSQKEALLFVVLQNMTSFVALDIFDGGVRVVANYGTAQPTVVRATGLVGYGICDGKAHTVSLRITETSVQISIDGGAMDETAIAERQTTNIQGPMFIGGIQDDRKSELTTGIITASLQGCISSLILNGQGQDLTAGFSKSGVRRGCPLAIP